MDKNIIVTYILIRLKLGLIRVNDSAISFETTAVIPSYACPAGVRTPNVAPSLQLKAAMVAVADRSLEIDVR